MAGVFISFLSFGVSLLALCEAHRAAALLKKREEPPAAAPHNADAPSPDRSLREWLYGERA